MKTIAIAANLFLVAAAIGFGNLLRPLIPKSFSLLDRIALILLGGLGLLGTILFCVGQVWFTRSAVVLVFLFGALLSLRRLRSTIRDCGSSLSVISAPALPAVIIFLVMLLTAVGGLALPTGDTNDDAIAYHYLGPKVWLQQRVIRPVPDEIQTYFPVVVEAQYAALMSLGGQRAPGFFAAIGIGSLLLMTASLAIRLGLDPTSAWWAAALVAAMPTIYRGGYGGFLDVLFAAFVLAAARMAFDAEQPGHFALFGIFCGICMGTKYTGIISWALLVPCSFLVTTLANRRRALFSLKWLGASCAVAIALASPFYLRNWIISGTPMYPAPPALLKLFTANYLQPAAVDGLVRAMNLDRQGMGGGIVNFFLLPFHLTYHTANFRGAGGIGLVPLALGPFGIIARRRDPYAMGLFLFAFLQVGAWFATAQVARYMNHVYVIGAIFGVIGWNYAVKTASRNGRILSQAAIAISILYGSWMIMSSRMEDVHAAVSRSFEVKRWDRETPDAASFGYINRESSVKKVLILNSQTAAYFIDKPYLKPFGRWGERTLGAANLAELLSLLPDLHATHVLDVRDEDGGFALPEHPAGFTLVFEHGDQRIYRIG